MGRRITVPSAGDQTGQSHADASLPNHLLLHIQRGFIPALTSRAPALVDPMVRDLHWRGRGHIDHLAAACQADAAQTQLTRGTRDQPMLHDLCWSRGAWPGSIMLAVTLLARLLLFLWRLLLIRRDCRWWRRFQLLKFLNACLGNSQLLADFFESL